MKRPRKKDFTGTCPKCRGEGETSYRTRQGGWDGHNVTVKETCSQCGGKKVWHDQDRYVDALNRYINFLEKKLKQTG